MAESEARTQFLLGETRFLRAIGNTDMVSSLEQVPVHRARGLTVRSEGKRWTNVNTLVFWRSFEIQIERDEEGWFVGTVPELPGCYTQARSKAELLKRLDEAIVAALSDHGDDLSKGLFGQSRQK